MIKPLTSLRFFFALFVFFSHLLILANDPLTDSLFRNVFSEGFLGVSFFFILSGFILSLTYKNKFLVKRVTLKEFFVARFARIYPIHIVTMIIAIPLPMVVLSEALPYHLFLLQSFVPDQNIHFSLNAPSWSISDEMFFYALFPFFIFFFYKIKTIAKILIVILMTSTVIIMNVALAEEFKHYWLYVSPLIRIFDFILGMFLYDFCIYIKRNFELIKPHFLLLEILAIIVFIMFFLLHCYIPISYRYSVYYWIPMLLIILAASKQYFSADDNGIFNYLLSNRIMVYLGEISFCFYMLHKLVISYVRGIFKFLEVDISASIIAVICFILALVASIFAFENIEKPLNKKIKAYFA